MSVRDIVQAAAGSSSVTYVDDVFSTYLYTGNGSTQTITNGIDLAGNGGMVWAKRRDGTAISHLIADTVRGAMNWLSTDTTAGQSLGTGGVSAFAATGFTIDNNNNVNTNTNTYASWTFRKAPKFFDVVTYTGDGAGSRSIAHSLDITPGMIIVKRTDTTSNWQVWQKDVAAAGYGAMVLNTTAAAVAGNYVFSGSAFQTATSFRVESDATVNANGATYVAYLFAHDTAADGLIQCGSFTTDALGFASVTLGWESQWVLIKPSSGVGNWQTYDIMRGMAVGASQQVLVQNLSNAETTTSNKVNLNATGFGIENSGSTTFIYLAIRRPNKPLTSGAQVYSPVVVASSTTPTTTVTTGFPVDLTLWSVRTNGSTFATDRLRGGPALTPNSTSAEETNTVDFDFFDSQTSVRITQGAGNNDIFWNFKRAPGFMDVVCYTGTGANLSINHGLGVTPEMMVIKARGAITNWGVYHSTIGPTKALYLNDSGTGLTATSLWNDTAPTASVFTVGTAGVTNTNASGMVAYLFATLPGISKVGSYIGNGSNQTINCGFSTGARFVLIKNSSAVGDWYVWDSVRGIVAANDPHLSLNTSAAEVTTDDSIDPDSTGFIINQVAATNINLTSNTYIYLAIS